MPTDAKVIETLEVLNRGYLLAAEKRDVGWYAEHLAEDYMATNPDGSLVDRAGFLERIEPGRYTDIWARRDGCWLCVSAHFTRC